MFCSVKLQFQNWAARNEAALFLIHRLSTIPLGKRNGINLALTKIGYYGHYGPSE
jgi:hypothetical protein